MALTTRKMSDAHEDWVVDLLGGRKSKNSGSQWHAQADGRQSSYENAYAFSWDCKGTLAKSASVSLAMWEKIRRQASPERPMVPLRFYANEKLDVLLDLVVVDAHDFAEILADANAYRKQVDG